MFRGHFLLFSASNLSVLKQQGLVVGIRKSWNRICPTPWMVNRATFLGCMQRTGRPTRSVAFHYFSEVSRSGVSEAPIRNVDRLAAQVPGRSGSNWSTPVPGFRFDERQESATKRHWEGSSPVVVVAARRQTSRSPLLARLYPLRSPSADLQ